MTQQLYYLDLTSPARLSYSSILKKSLCIIEKIKRYFRLFIQLCESNRHKVWNMAVFHFVEMKLAISKYTATIPSQLLLPLRRLLHLLLQLLWSRRKVILGIWCGRNMIILWKVEFKPIRNRGNETQKKEQVIE